MRRAALYFGPSARQISHADLQPYFARTRANGLRIVTAKQEASQSVSYRPVLRHLLDRMGVGEFELILTVVGPYWGYTKSSRASVR